MIDASEMTDLAADLSRSGVVAVVKVRPIMSKGALNVKNRMQQDARGSRHFSQIGRTIGYDLIDSVDGIEAEIGPTSPLAGIAYFGSSKPGGGTVPDPLLALEEEAPRFVQNLAEAVGFEFG